MSSNTHPDLLPLPSYLRNWGAPHFAALWIVITASTPTFVLGASLGDGTISSVQLIAGGLIGAIITAAVAIVCGRLGASHGTPFTGIMRRTFGPAGGHLPTLLRAVLGIILLSTGCWVGAGVIESMLTTLHLAAPPAPDTTISVLRLSCLVLLLAVSCVLSLTGGEGLRRIAFAGAPLLVLAAIALCGWGAWQLHAAGMPLLRTGSSDALTPAAGIITLWLVVALTASDFTRHAEPESHHAIGQIVGIAIGTLLFIIAGCIGTGATMAVFGESARDPALLVSRLAGSSVTMAIIGGGLLLIAIVTTMVIAHLAGTARCLSGASGGRISPRTGAVIACAAGAAVMPWHWTGAALALIVHVLAIALAASVAVALCDQLIIRRAHTDQQTGEPEIASRHVGTRALIASGVGIAAALPALIHGETRSLAARMETIALGGAAELSSAGITGTIFAMGWPIAALTGVVSYVLLMMQPAAQQQQQQQQTDEAGVLAGT